MFIMGFKVISVCVYKQSMMVENDCIIHCIDIFSTIKLSPMCLIIPQFSNLDQIVVNETNIIWQLLEL
jgi:hypothetical protein